LQMSDDPIEPSMSLLQWREQCCAWNAIIAALFFDIIGMFGTRVNCLWSLLFKGTAHTKCSFPCSRTHHYIGSSQSTIAFSFQYINQLINARKHVKPRVNKCIRCDCWNELNSICYKANHNFQEFLFLSLFFLLWKETQLCQIKTIDTIHKRKWRNFVSCQSKELEWISNESIASETCPPMNLDSAKPFWERCKLHHLPLSHESIWFKNLKHPIHGTSSLMTKTCST
jgi:hypothetical protein